MDAWRYDIFAPAFTHKITQTYIGKYIQVKDHWNYSPLELLIKSLTKIMELLVDSKNLY